MLIPYVGAANVLNPQSVFVYFMATAKNYMAQMMQKAVPQIAVIAAIMTYTAQVFEVLQRVAGMTV